MEDKDDRTVVLIAGVFTLVLYVVIIAVSFGTRWLS